MLFNVVVHFSQMFFFFLFSEISYLVLLVFVSVFFKKYMGILFWVIYVLLGLVIVLNYFVHTISLFVVVRMVRTPMFCKTDLYLGAPLFFIYEP